MIKKIGKILMDVVYPEDIYCIVCGKPIEKTLQGEESYSLCPECRKTILHREFIICQKCGRLMDDREARICRECMRRPPLYDRGIAAVRYEPEGRRIIHGLKYGNKTYLAKNIAILMKDTLKEVGYYDIIVPVPMYPEKKKIRGFCQTSLICGELGKLTGKPVSLNNLSRVKKTAAMSSLNPESRRMNIRNAFEVGNGEEFMNKTILLVDDLLTTGSTGSECARVLKGSGARKVYLAVFASASL